MEGTEVAITLRSEQRILGEPTQVVQEVTGRLLPAGDGFLLCYREDGSTGLEGAETSLLFKRRDAALERTGSVGTRMRFHVGERTQAFYRTAYGTAELLVETSYLRHNIAAGGGSAMIRYVLLDRGGPVGDYTLKIHIRKKDEIE